MDRYFKLSIMKIVTITTIYLYITLRYKNRKEWQEPHYKNELLRVLNKTEQILLISSKFNSKLRILT